MDYREHRSYPPPPKTMGEWIMTLVVGMIVAAGCLLSVVLLMLLSGSLAAHWHGKRSVLMMLGIGGVMSVVPAFVLNGFLTWLRQQWNENALFRDTMFPVLLVGNTLFLVALVLFLPGKTSQALHKHGDWMFDEKVASFLEINEQHMVLRAGRKMVRRMAYLLEVESQRARIARTRLASRPASASPSKAKAPQSSDAAPPPTINNLTPPGRGLAVDVPDNPSPPTPSREPIRPLPPKTPTPPAPLQQLSYLQFRKHGSVPEVGIQLGRIKTQYLWDTGASFLTLTKRMARRLGALPRYGSPSIVVHTANGRVHTRVGLLESMKVGKFRLKYVAFVLCDACADGSSGVAGLLGSNVQRRFKFSIDHSKGRIELRPQPPPQWSNQALDMRPFLKPKRLKGNTLNLVVRRVFRLSALIHNRAPIGVKGLKYQVTYLRNRRSIGQKTFTILPLRAGQRRRIAFMDNKAPKFHRYRIELIEGRWSSR